MTNRRTISLAAAGALALGFAATGAGPALAQKSKDTLRMPHNVQLQTIDFFITPGPWDGVFSPAIYSGLIDFNPKTGKYVPAIAKSWKQVDPVTYEFELFDDLKWSDGEAIDADDVVYIINWLVDPKVRLRLKANWTFIKAAEKLGPHKVRIVTKRPTPFALQRLAHRTYIYPEHIHRPIDAKKKRLFASKGVSYGAYRLARFDKAKGHMFVKNEGYRGNEVMPKAKIGTVVSPLIPDAGTRTAQLLSGRIDLTRQISPEIAINTAKTGRFIHSALEGLGFQYLAVYGQSQENVKALADLRVRRAIGMAIDRATVQKLHAAGAKINDPMNAICVPAQIGCGFTKTTPAYDPAGAKKLLAEAGFADGFNIKITTFAGSIRKDAQVVAGMLRKVGLRPTVQGVPIPSARKLARDRKLELIYYAWGGGGIYDVSAAMARFFMRPEFEDKKLRGMARKTMSIMDPEARKAAVTQAIDYAVDKGYLYPMIRNVVHSLHTKEVVITPAVQRPLGYILSDLSWK